VAADPIVSRIDVTVDFGSAVGMDGWSRSCWITRAEYKQNHSVGERFSGWSIGLRGPVAFRLYDKTREIEKSKESAYV
jgi:hypothetical protein